MRLFSCVVVALAVAVSGCGGGDSNSSPTSPTAPAVNVPFSTVDLTVGTGPEAGAGSRVAVNYTGWLYSTTAAENKGTKFDSSLDPGRTPYVFVIGTNSVIAGFDQGVRGMRVGGIRRVTIPPNLAYGSQGTSGIPPNSTLIFEIALVGIQ